ncbi:restriction endonuclease subunit S domain-containing protein [Micromonospora chalcea]|uniref:hypothetical protein n=1 Tax=Micromonospora chalcea TaxID=1874 RepID=UPI0034069CFC
MTQASFGAAFIAPEEVTPKRLDANFYRATYRQAAQRAARLPSAPLSSLVKAGTVITYGVIKSVQVESGVPMLRIQNLQSGFADADGAVRISTEQHQGFSRSALSGGELLIAIGGYVGVAAKYPNDGPIANINQHVAKADIDLRRANDYYALAYLWSQTGTLLLQRTVTGTVQAGISLGDLRAFAVPLPDRRVQDYIGAKVELAERCRAVSSRSWLAATELLEAALGAPLTPETFEVKSASNVSGSGYEVTSIRPVVALVSPARLVGAIGAQFFTPRRAKAILVIEQSGLGAKRLSALADRFTKRVSADEVQARGLSYVGLAQVDSSMGYVSTATDEQPSSSSACFGARDILFSKLRPYLNKVAICPEHLDEAAGSSELVTYRAKPGVDPYYVFFVLKSPLVLNQVIDITSGSTHPRVAPDLIDDVLVPLAEAPVQKRIGRLARVALELRRRATLLVEDAKADVEALIEGTLDVQAILSGTVKAPTADDIPELAEDGT